MGLQTGDIGLDEYLDALQAHFAKREPEVIAFLDEKGRWQRLRREAAALERRYRDPKKRPPLFGMPVGVKDIFRVDGFPTRAGSKLPARALRGPEAESVRRLRAAGALIMGKTVTTEFAYFAPGPTRNPHNPAHTPGGSSSGSAAAVGAGLAPLALGTQTIGSVTRPASFCGVVGFKPSYGRISAKGVIPLSKSLDHVGLFAPDVFTAQLGASALVEGWRAGATASNRPMLAVAEGEYLEHADAEMRSHFEGVVERLRDAGFWVKRLNPMPDFGAIVARHNLIMAAQAAEAHRRWYFRYRKLYNERTAALIEQGLEIGKAELEAALREATYFSNTMITLMDIHGIDLWVSPAAVGAAPKGLESTGDPVMNLPWTQAGLPTLGLPTGTAKNGLPLGTQLTADWGRDEELFAWGRELEAVLTGNAKK
jgi:Asp-tRNA(Asn)/Glu-tRNA(Gln) amidotransferase A subunit family amidase